jgi:hypothetical protein
MRNGQNHNNNNKNRMRGRNRRGHNPMTRVYESNGPDVKIRGTAHHVAEKYSQLARDAQSSGDPVAAEGYLQHAEHYYRLIMAAQAQFVQQNPHAQSQQAFQRPDMDGRGDDFDDDGDDTGEQPMQNGQPFQNGAPNQQMQPRPQHQNHQNNQNNQGQPQPMHQPQPSVQGYQRRDDEQRDAGLPAFITGGAPQPQGNGGENEQGDRGDRFGRRRRRFRPRGPNDTEQRGEGAADTAAPAGDTAKPGE